MKPFHNIYIIRSFFAKHWLLYGLGIVILIIVNILQLVIPRLVGFSVDTLIEGKTGINNYLALLVVVSVAIAVLRYVYRELIMGTTRRLESWLREGVFAFIQKFLLFSGGVQVKSSAERSVLPQ